MPEATEHTDTYHRHGDPDPSKWDEGESVTDRPNDTPLRGVDEPAVPNSTLASRAKARKVGAKQVDKDEDAVENKAVTSAAKKTPAKARKK